MRSERGIRAGVVGAVGFAAAVAALGADRASDARPAGAGAAARPDSVPDSLLVSDSLYQGWKWWHIYCYRCHGQDAIGGVSAAAPDLRWAISPSGANFPRDSFIATALTGRMAKGMPAWNVLLDTTSIQELYLYVKARAEGWLKPGRPHRLSDLKTQGPKTP